jgi:hypothetical protein
VHHRESLVAFEVLTSIIDKKQQPNQANNSSNPRQQQAQVHPTHAPSSKRSKVQHSSRGSRSTSAVEARPEQKLTGGPTQTAVLPNRLKARLREVVGGAPMRASLAGAWASARSCDRRVNARAASDGSRTSRTGAPASGFSGYGAVTEERWRKLTQFE